MDTNIKLGVTQEIANMGLSRCLTLGDRIVELPEQEGQIEGVNYWRYGKVVILYTNTKPLVEMIDADGEPFDALEQDIQWLH